MSASPATPKDPGADDAQRRRASLSSASSAATDGDADGSAEQRRPPPPPLVATLTRDRLSSGRGLPPPPHPGRVVPLRRPPSLDLVAVRHEDISVAVGDDREAQTQDYDTVALSPLQPRHRQAQRASWAMSIYYKHFPQWLQTKRRFRTVSVESDATGGARVATNSKKLRHPHHHSDDALDSDSLDSDNAHLEHIYSSWRVRWATRLDVALEAAWVVALVARGVLFDVPLEAFASWVWIVQLLAHSLRLASFFQHHILALCTYTRVISLAHVLSWELLAFHEVALALAFDESADPRGGGDEADGSHSLPRFGWHTDARLAFAARVLVAGDLGRTLPLLVNVVVLSRAPSVKDVAIGDYLSGKRARRVFSFFARLILPTALTLTHLFAFPPPGTSSLFGAALADADVHSRLEVCLPALVGCIGVAYFVEFLISTPHLLPVRIGVTQEECDMDRQATFADINRELSTVSPSSSRSSRSIEVAYSRNGDVASAADRNKKKKWACLDFSRKKKRYPSYSASASGSGGRTPMYRTHGMGAAAGRGLQGPAYTG